MPATSSPANTVKSPQVLKATIARRLNSNKKGTPTKAHVRAALKQFGLPEGEDTTLKKALVATLAGHFAEEKMDYSDADLIAGEWGNPLSITFSSA